MIYPKKAFAEFDIVLCVNNFQKKEIIELNEIYKSKTKSWKSKYLFIDFNKFQNKKLSKKILIAPTWGTNFFDQKYHLKLKKVLDQGKYKFELRPHYMSYKKNKFLKDELKKDFILSEGKINFFNYHTIITDWSGIFLEFSKATLSKCILLETPEKKLNHDFNLISNIPIEVYSREILAYKIDEDNFNNINHMIEKVILEKNFYEKEIVNFFKENFF